MERYFNMLLMLRENRILRSTSKFSAEVTRLLL
jgi:hypothetical protein